MYTKLPLLRREARFEGL